MSYFFHPNAEAEYLESIAFYESKKSGLGAMFFTEFEQQIKVVCESPKRFPIEAQPEVRRVQMKRFPFTILYRDSSKQIQILAVAHHRRRPQYWLHRVYKN